MTDEEEETQPEASSSNEPSIIDLIRRMQHSMQILPFPSSSACTFNGMNVPAVLDDFATHTRVAVPKLVPWVMNTTLTSAQGDVARFTDDERSTRSAAQDALIARIEHAFTYHAPTPEQITRYQQLRDAAKALALLFVDVTPISREQSLALEALEGAVMWANAAIARDEHVKATHDGTSQ